MTDKEPDVTDEVLKMPRVGDPAPDIDRDATGDGRFRLADHRGRWVVVYFFPRANTPG
jgi:thioredoxin-dependent peroxiredoxin